MNVISLSEIGTYDVNQRGGSDSSESSHHSSSYSSSESMSDRQYDNLVNYRINSSKLRGGNDESGMLDQIANASNKKTEKQSIERTDYKINFDGVLSITIPEKQKPKHVIELKMDTKTEKDEEYDISTESIINDINNIDINGSMNNKKPMKGGYKKFFTEME